MSTTTTKRASRAEVRQEMLDRQKSKAIGDRRISFNLTEEQIQKLDAALVTLPPGQRTKSMIVQRLIDKHL